VSTPLSAAPAQRTALVLSGGGITGFLFEIGVLAALEEALPAGGFARSFDLFIGTSAGSVAAALIANGAAPGEIFRSLHDDARSPFNFRATDIFGLAGTGKFHLLSKFGRPLVGSIGRAIRGRTLPTLAWLIADYQEHHPPGLYSTEPLERTLCERFDALGFPHRFDELPRSLYVTGSDIDTGERLVFGDGEFRDMHVCRAIAASCAIPIFFQPIRVGERDVVDGAVAEATPVSLAVARGARMIVSVNPLVPILNDRSKLCLPIDGRYCARLSEKGVGWLGEQAFRIMLAAKLEDTLLALRTRYTDLVVHSIEPCREELPMFMNNVMSFAARRELLEYGLVCGRRAAEAGVAQSLRRAGEATLSEPAPN
jgi:predicted acylesterase/phospholipase RssA